MKKIKQFRYFNEHNENNYPQGLSSNDLYDGVIFNDYTPITQIGIQALPGTKFYLNNEETRSNEIIMGYTGLYELNLEGIAEINTLCFELESIRRISEVPGACLIIDMVYEGEM